MADEKSDAIQPIAKTAEIEGADSESPCSPKDTGYHHDSVLEDDLHVNLGWRSWLVVFVTCFAYVVPPTGLFH